MMQHGRVPYSKTRNVFDVGTSYVNPIRCGMVTHDFFSWHQAKVFSYPGILKTVFRFTMAIVDRDHHQNEESRDEFLIQGLWHTI